MAETGNTSKSGSAGKQGAGKGIGSVLLAVIGLVALYDFITQLFPFAGGVPTPGLAATLVLAINGLIALLSIGYFATAAGATRRDGISLAVAVLFLGKFALGIAVAAG